MGTVNDLLKRSLQNCGALGVGETIPGDELDDLFTRLNNMISQWSNKQHVIYEDTEVTKTLTTNDGEYTIGSGADINTTKPIAIKTAFVRGSDNDDHPLRIIDEHEYNLIYDKSDIASYPRLLYYDTGHPTGTIKLWPVPSEAYTLHMTVHAPLTAFTGTNQTIALPEGYEQTIEMNYTKLIAPIYGKSISPEHLLLAEEGLNEISRANRSTDRNEQQLDFPGQGETTFDIYTRGGT